MNPDQIGQALHDRATRGQALSSEELDLLNQWYARQDQAEMAALGAASGWSTIETLRAQLASAASQLVEVTQRIQAQIVENDGLRQEVAALRQQLAARPTKQPA